MYDIVSFKLKGYEFYELDQNKRLVESLSFKSDALDEVIDIASNCLMEAPNSECAIFMITFQDDLLGIFKEFEGQADFDLLATSKDMCKDAQAYLTTFKDWLSKYHSPFYSLWIETFPGSWEVV